MKTGLLYATNAGNLQVQLADYAIHAKFEDKEDSLIVR
jgi:hypothetical protein